MAAGEKILETLNRLPVLSVEKANPKFNKDL
jgi:hypothetical protein